MFRLIEELRAILLPQEKYRLIFLTLLVFFAALLELCGIGLIMPVIALFITPELFEQNRFLILVKHLIGDLPFQNFLLILSSGIILFFCFKSIVLYLVAWLQIRFSYSMTSRIGAFLLRKYIGTRYEFSLGTSAGALSGKIQQSRNISDFVNSIMMLISESMVIFLIFLSIFILAPLTALLLTVCGALFSWGVYCIMKRLVRHLSLRALERNSKLNSFIIFSMEALREIKTGGREAYFLDRSVQIEDAAIEPERQLFLYSQLPRFIIEAGTVAFGMGTIIILLLSGVAPASIALKVSFVGIALLRMMPSVSRIHYYLARIRANLPLFHAISEDLRDVLPEKQEESAPPITFEKEIVFENAKFAYGNSTVFSGVNLKIPKNKTLALVGPTGCGKSTLLDVACGLLPLTSGRISADGRDIWENIFSWRKSIGYVPQTVVLEENTVLENVGMGLPKEKIDRERVRECLRIAQALDFVEKLEHGIDSVLSERGKNLSGGQRQRIGIARALYSNPSILIFDEATSALDIETEAAFVESLSSLNGKFTMLIAAHRLSTIEHCDQIYRFQSSNAESIQKKE